MADQETIVSQEPGPDPELDDDGPVDFWEEEPEPDWVEPESDSTDDQEPDDQDAPEDSSDEPQDEEKPEGGDGSPKDHPERGSPPEGLEIDGKMIPAADLAEAYKARQYSISQQNEAKNVRQAAQETLMELARNPERTLMAIYARQFGDEEIARQKVFEIGKRIVAPAYEEKLLPPEEVAKRRFEREKADFERRQQEFEERRQAAELENSQKRFYDWVDGEIGSAISEASLEPQPWIIKRVAASIAHQINSGQLQTGEEVSIGIRSVVREIREEEEAREAQRRQEIISSLTPEQLAEYRKDLIDAARKQDIEAAKKQRREISTKPKAGKNSPTNEQRRERGKRKYKDREEYRRSVGYYG